MPNLITLLRVLMIPLLCLCFLQTPFGWSIRVWGWPPPMWVIVLILLAGFSDFVDGHVARHWDIQSTFGKLADPIADKLFVTTCWIFLMFLGRLHPVEVLLAISRDVLMNALRSYAGSLGVVISAKRMAKVKTVIQFFSIGFLVYGRVLPAAPWLPTMTVGRLLFWLALFFSYLTLFRYSVHFFEKQRR